METEDEDMSYIIHLAVAQHNQTIIRYLVENSAFFRLFSEKSMSNVGSFNRSVDARLGQNQRPANPWDQVETEDMQALITSGDAAALTQSKSKSPALIEDVPEETILSLQDSLGNTALHLLFKYSNRNAIK